MWTVKHFPKTVPLSGAHFPDCEENAGGFRQEGLHRQPRPRSLPWHGPWERGRLRGCCAPTFETDGHTDIKLKEAFSQNVQAEHVFFFKCVLNHVKITFAAGQKHPVFTIRSCRSEIKTSDLWDYCVTEHGTTGTNVPERSRCLSKCWSPPLDYSTHEHAHLQHMWRGFKWSALNWKMFCFLLGFGVFLWPDQRSETWSQLQVRFIPEYSINTLISCFFYLHFYVGCFCIQNLNDISSVLWQIYLHFIDKLLDLCWLEGSDWLQTSPAKQGSAQVSIRDPSLDVVFSGDGQDPWPQLHFYTG